MNVCVLVFPTPVLSQALCLPISVPELLHKTSSGGIEYLVIDCRPKAVYDAGHLPGAVNLDPETMLAGLGTI